jgi:hypothetical protein
MVRKKRNSLNAYLEQEENVKGFLKLFSFSSPGLVAMTY